MNLTEQWKKGELPEGWYYVKDEDGQTIIAEYYAECIDRETNETECVWSCLGEPEQVLEKVPSYEEWDKLNNACHELEKETACLTVDIVKLKELLKELKRYFDANGRYYIEKRILLEINQILGEE